ncbi:fimbrial chaperone [Scandinavium goeteborgense]|nr:fimbrial chaperone [Scandinavium goeteborgense]
MMKEPLRHGMLVLLGAALFCATAAVSHASVTIMGSRIIFGSAASSVDVQLKNSDSFPYVVQTWFDDGDVNASPQDSSAVPFIATPPIFRIQPKAGQIVRIVYSKTKSLPHDRESVYWFNALQLPPANVGGEQKQNKMLVVMRTRIKLFYRPASLGQPGELVKKLQLKAVSDAKKGAGVEITNPNPWFASVSNLSARVNGIHYAMTADMVAPFASRTFWLSGKAKAPQGKGSVNVTLVNDQGARMSEHYDVIWR